MAKADQLIQLLKSHIDGDQERFYSIAMQVAAYEAQRGHEKLAQQLKKLIDEAKKNNSAIVNNASVVSFIQPKGDLANLLSVEYKDTHFAQLTFSTSLKERFQRLLSEQKKQKVLAKYNLKPRRKLLLYGPPGTGKTVTASAIAGELNVPLFTIRLDTLITKYMGETASKLRLIFDAMKNTRAVYFFDEFDAIGGDRNLGNDVGEIRRVLNSFLQFMEQDTSDSIVLAATNHVKLLDNALFRRFDDVIEYSLPDSEQIRELIKNKLHSFSINTNNFSGILSISEGLSHAEVTRACDEAAKHSVLSGLDYIPENFLLDALEERKYSCYSFNR